ncbi:MAG: hypothetical protein LBO04_04565 [Spirochaetaceae bacterium]|nr:hypothetical protein [Spirochaetaceae bacterium]
MKKINAKNGYCAAILAAALLLFASCDTGVSPSTGTGAAAGIRVLKVAGVQAETAGKITVYVPYYEGFDPAALDVSG